MYKDVEYVFCFSGGHDTTYLLSILRAINSRRLLIYFNNDSKKRSDYEELEMRGYFQNLNIQFHCFRSELKLQYAHSRKNMYKGLLSVIESNCANRVFVIIGHSATDYTETIKMRLRIDKRYDPTNCFHYINSFLYRSIEVVFWRPLFFSDTNRLRDRLKSMFKSLMYPGCLRRQIRNNSTVMPKITLKYRLDKIKQNDIDIVLDNSIESVERFVRNYVYSNTQYTNKKGYIKENKYTCFKHEIRNIDNKLYVRPELEYSEIVDNRHQILHISNYYSIHIYINKAQRLIYRYAQTFLYLYIDNYFIKITKFDNREFIIMTDKIFYIRTIFKIPKLVK